MTRRIALGVALLSGLVAAALLLRASWLTAPAVVRDPARSLLLVTIDTIRADHVGAYGAARVATPALDRMARDGVRFDRAFAAAPITLTSHASLLTGRYPPGHGARHNGVPVDAAVPTLATALKAKGFATAAFIAAFPLDRRFGLARGFDAYSDAMPRGRDGRPANERPGSAVVDEALTWLAAHRDSRFFLWVHLFEPHAPYGDSMQSPGLSAIVRYDREIETADRQVGRLLDGLGPASPTTIVVAAGDHGEAFGEHGEIGHSIFVYDTTLRVPLLICGAGVPKPGLTVTDPACLIDIPPTVMAMLGVSGFDSDGVDLGPAIEGRRLAARALYAESFAPQLDFGWSPLRVVRAEGWKFIEAPRSELFDTDRDAGEAADRASSEPATLAKLRDRLNRFGGPDLPERAPAPFTRDPEAAVRLRALGYTSGQDSTRPATGRPDPKDRKQLAARIAQVTAGELHGPELRAALEGIVRDDPGNLQAHLRLGYALVEEGEHRRAESHFSTAIAARMPTADAYLGLALCQVERGAITPAMATLREADAVEPGNPVVRANIGLLQARAGRVADAITSLSQALEIDPGLHEARFNLALVLARAGRREEATRQTQDLLRRLPAEAPQRPEVERLLATLRK